jgi:hypothetical protein
MKRTTASVVAFVACTAIASGAKAQARCPAMEGAVPALAEQDAEARFAAVHEVMRHQAARATTYKWAWVGISLGLTAVGWAEYPFVDDDKRLPQAITATAPLFIAVQTLVLPLRAPSAFDDLEALPQGDACARLAQAEKLLVQTADDEAEHTGVLAHVISLATSAAYMTALQLAFKDPRYTWLDGGGSFLVGEAQVLSTPTGARGALDRYREGNLGAATESAFTWTLAPVGKGFGFVATF